MRYINFIDYKKILQMPLTCPSSTERIGEENIPTVSSTKLLQQMNKYLAFKCLMAITTQTPFSRERKFFIYLHATLCAHTNGRCCYWENMLISILNQLCCNRLFSVYIRMTNARTRVYKVSRFTLRELQYRYYTARMHLNQMCSSSYQSVFVVHSLHIQGRQELLMNE